MVACLGACQDGDRERGAGGEDTGAAAPSSSAGLIGLDAPGNDPAVVALAKQALKCRWKHDHLNETCVGMRAWYKADELKQGKADRTLVNFLADEDDKVRWLAAFVLSAKSQTFATDRALAERVVAAAQAERSKQVAGALGQVAGRIDATQTGLRSGMEGLLLNHPMREFRLGMVKQVLKANAGFFDLMMKLATTEADEVVRSEAMRHLGFSTPKGRRAEVCAMWVERMQNDPDEPTQGEAAQLAGNSRPACEDAWDTIIDVIGKRAKADKLRGALWGPALGAICRQENASDAQKKRALAAARALVENRQHADLTRTNALDVIGRHDPNAKTYAKRFANDDSELVRNKANAIAHGKRIAAQTAPGKLK